MTFGLFKVMHLCPECGSTLKRLGVKCEDGHWIKVWGCHCCPTVEEIIDWENEVAIMRNAMSRGSEGQA